MKSLFDVCVASADSGTPVYQTGRGGANPTVTLHSIKQSLRVVEVKSRSRIDWMISEHYLHRWPGVVVAMYALTWDGRDVGCMVFALPPKQTEMRYGSKVWELARLWVSDEMPKNTESWFIGITTRLVLRRVPMLVSYADPSVGHAGTIYKATNWRCDGMTDQERKSPRCDYVACGKRYSRRSHVPDGVEVQRVPRVSKHRFTLSR